MKWVYPNYYSQFRCIAGDCKHNCCIGWEIDVDGSTMRKYLRMQGEAGDEIRRHIGGTVLDGHITMQKDGRCPFLNQDNLCKLILEKGEKTLCQICRDHPRFRLRLTDREELGLGLCCEAACRLILDQSEPVRWIVEDSHQSKAVPTQFETRIMTRRDQLVALAQDRSLPIMQRMGRIMAADGNLSLPDLSFAQWVDILLKLERMDEQWTRLLEKRRNAHVFTRIADVKQEQLLVYFLYRYYLSVKKKRTYDRGVTAFCVLSVQLIAMLCENPGDIYEVARMYSAEVEYSDENVDALLSALHDYNDYEGESL